MRKDLINNVIHSDQQSINLFAQGDIHHRIFNEIGLIQGKLIFGTIYFLKDIIFFIFLLISILLISKKLFILLLCFALLFYINNILTGKKITNNNAEQSRFNSSLSAYFIEILNGKEDIKIFHLEDKIKNKIRWIEKKLIPLIRINSKQNAFHFLSIEFLIILFISLVAFILIYEGLNTSEVITVTIYILFLLWPIREMNNYIISIYSIIPSLNRVENFFNASNIEKVGSVSTFNLNPQSEGLCLNIKNLNFSYYGKPILLENINYKFTKGTYILKGDNGAGKTTFLKILAGILPVTSGEINLYYDKNQYPETCIRLIQQTPFLFSGTIMENLAIVKPKISEEEIRKILISYNLDNIFNEFENKLHTQIGENGKYISAGQRQLISILRALIEDPIVLLLDEITSNLSEALHANIVNNIYTNRKDKINIFISHQSENMKYDDLIIFNAKFK